ncbi:MAG: hypothetical protein QS748_00930 [Candidatus Endonucleobacter bathymodioli]|uniref:tRNA-modifying protein YgfZ n=1 Tax=Candidatus Endonucleibacter bathymodioli TaxID=539814 RepID=A0AA90SS03_9GAMM|nr:hypothetical protein [Candidatus Endonucleobacter bathymodioli]
MNKDSIHHLKTHGALFSNDGKITSFSNSKAPANNSPSMCVLTSQAIIEAEGPDTMRFLQGQLTCNMEKLNPMEHMLGAACTPNGKMYSSFLILNTGNQYLLSMHQGVTESFISNLDKYSVFFKSKLIPSTQNFICLGLTGNNTKSHLTDIWRHIPSTGGAVSIEKAYLLKTPHLNGSYELWLPEKHLSLFWEKLTATFTPETESLWRKKHIEAVYPQVQPSYIDKYTPQHLNLPSLSSVSFRKGCYTGQEIIARMQNLGTQKSRTFHIHIATNKSILPRAKLINANGKTIGEILEAVSVTEDKYDALAVIKIESAENNNVFLADSNDYKITIATTPYLIDTKSELQH